MRSPKWENNNNVFLEFKTVNVFCVLLSMEDLCYQLSLTKYHQLSLDCTNEQYRIYNLSLCSVVKCTISSTHSRGMMVETGYKKWKKKVANWLQIHLAGQGAEKIEQSLRSFIVEGEGPAYKVADWQWVAERRREEGNWIIKTSRGGVIILMSLLWADEPLRRNNSEE